MNLSKVLNLEMVTMSLNVIQSQYRPNLEMVTMSLNVIQSQYRLNLEMVTMSLNVIQSQYRPNSWRKKSGKQFCIK
jgi:hypothetical protein